MSIAKHIYLRYRAAGHVRFAVPASLCQPLPARHLQEALQQTAGVRRVNLYPRQGKLSIRYQEGVADVKSVSRALFDIVAGIESHPEEFRHGLVLQQAGADAAEGLPNLKKRGTRPLWTPAREKLALEFCTDLLVLYLIRLHWDMILGSWIKRPWQYRYQWMATVYLIFLLVRSKKPK